ncbi:MAG TPA: hypothetical protein VJ842_14025 [Pyrinomonadaceae bacterium]|nr:hypothetical protein [Pyrinomonadaceae bacterium]
MTEKRVPLYERLPEIYRTKDAEQTPPDQLRAYLALVEEAFGAIHENIESLYHDLFIETSDDWVVPYIGDLLGTTHLSGDPWTLRADVADTIALRRRKGTLGAIELLTYNLTKWGVNCVELRENMLWNQHLNHQRPDEGGQPPYSLPSVKRQTAIRGGTITLRDPALLAMLNTPFDPFAHTADVKPPAIGNVRYNLPNLAIFLWRLAAYRMRVTKPVSRGAVATGAASPLAAHIARFNVNPLARPYVPPASERQRQPVRLFNSHRFELFRSQGAGIDRLDPSQVDFDITQVDQTPGAIPTARLTQGSAAGAPHKYVSIETYDAANNDLKDLDLSEVGLQLHLPVAQFPADQNQTASWKIRGANLCAWETGLQPPLANKEVVIDPIIGRIMIGVDTAPKAAALADKLLLTYTYGAVGAVGAHPVSRPALPREWSDLPVGNFRRVNFHTDPDGLRKALENIHAASAPVVIEIEDSMTHVLDLAHNDLLEETVVEDGGRNLKLNNSLIIRAADNQRPIIKLTHPLRFRPANVASAAGEDSAEQEQFDAVMSKLTVRLEGLFITRGEAFPAGRPLIARAALNRLEVIGCTLDPEGFVDFHGDRAPVLPSVSLREPYGFASAADETAFDQTPEIIISQSITGALLIDSGYQLSLNASIIDAGQGANDAAAKYAVTGATDPAKGWGPPVQVTGATFFGRTRVERASGVGGIWVHALEVHDNQRGCIKFSYFSGEAEDRLPQNHACVRGKTAVASESARLRFTSEIFGEPAYGQLAHTTDFRVRERGPNDDQMGAYGFLLEAHKWRNLQIRYREFMPVGARALLIPVT